jgi:hypothetical protein
MSVKADLARMKKRIEMLGGAPSARTAKMLEDLTAEERAFVAKAVELMNHSDEEAAVRALSDEELDRRLNEGAIKVASEHEAAADAALAAAGSSLRTADIKLAREILLTAEVWR